MKFVSYFWVAQFVRESKCEVFWAESEASKSYKMTKVLIDVRNQKFCQNKITDKSIKLS